MSTPSIAFIQTPCDELDDDRLEAPLGLLYLATLLNGRRLRGADRRPGIGSPRAVGVAYPTR